MLTPQQKDRSAEEDGDMAASGSASEREQMGRGDFAKVETAKTRGQVQTEERGKAVEVHLAQRFSVEYREEVHEKVQKESVIFSFACRFGVLLALKRLDSEE